MEMALKNQELKEVASIGVKMDQFDEDIRNMKESVEKYDFIWFECFSCLMNMGIFYPVGG